MMAAIFGVRPDITFWDKLQKDECKLLSEFYRSTDKIMRLETAREAIQARLLPLKITTIMAKNKKMEIAAHL